MSGPWIEKSWSRNDQGCFLAWWFFRDPANIKVGDGSPTARDYDFTDFGMVLIPLRLGAHSPRPPHARRVRFPQGEYFPAYIILNGIGKSIKYFSFQTYVGPVSGAVWILIWHKWNLISSHCSVLFLGVRQFVFGIVLIPFWRTKSLICSERLSESTSSQKWLPQNHVVGLNC